MDKVRDLFVDARLLQGAPLIPPEVSADEKEAAIMPIEPEPEKESTHGETEQESEMTTIAAQSKVVMREVVVSGKAEEVLGTAVQFTEKTKEGIEVLEKIIAMTKKRLDADPDAEGLSSLTASQLELFWKFIQAPEFQNLTASLLAKMLQ
ncbi:MAG TPA: hypothetical protein GXX69_03865 [Firmicutes bacterium]|nr:hypothetical protein [Bacillota bacterium]